MNEKKIMLAKLQQRNQKHNLPFCSDCEFYVISTIKTTFVTRTWLFRFISHANAQIFSFHLKLFKTADSIPYRDMHFT